MLPKLGDVQQTVVPADINKHIFAVSLQSLTKTFDFVD